MPIAKHPDPSDPRIPRSPDDHEHDAMFGVLTDYRSIWQRALRQSETTGSAGATLTLPVALPA
jgi:hypothetical protein